MTLWPGTAGGGEGATHAATDAADAGFLFETDLNPIRTQSFNRFFQAENSNTDFISVANVSKTRLLLHCRSPPVAAGRRKQPQSGSKAFPGTSACHSGRESLLESPSLCKIPLSW